MTTRFQASPLPSAVPFGVARKVDLQDLPAFYAWQSAHLLPEFDRQMNIGGAAETWSFLVEIWPVDTGLSVNSWEAGINAAPDALGAPGPRPNLTRRQAEERLSGVKSGDTIIVANNARKDSAATSYASLLWEGSSRKMPRGAEGPLRRHLKGAQDAIVRRAEERALGGRP